MMNIFDEMDNMFRQVDAMFNYPLVLSSMNNKGLNNRGLKPIIHRPHDLITRKDKDGNVTGYGIRVVYTPFSKSDVKVEVLDHVLTVKCGNENKVKDEEMDYCGISRQSYEFTLPLAKNIDEGAIAAKAEDGILHIELPVKKIEEAKPEPLSIEVK